MRRLIFALLMGCLVIVPVAYGQSEPGTPGTPATLPSPADGATVLSGWLQTIYGDPLPGTAAEPRYLTVLQDDQGTIIAQLVMDDSAARELTGQRVQVVGESGAPMTAQAVSPLVIVVQSIQAISPQRDPQTDELSDTAAYLGGSQPWLNLPCQFAGNTNTPQTIAHYDSMLSPTYPGLDHFWRQISYNNINLTGSTTAPQWYMLPQPLAYYSHDNVVEFDKVVQDCTAAADADIFYPNFVGINLMLNDAMDCCAYGGGAVLTRDGQTRSYRVTWLPPGGQTFDIVAHEMGHAFGFPHSSGPSSNPPSGADIYVSKWDLMSVTSGTCAAQGGSFGCLSPGTIAYHLDLDGWIPTLQRRLVLIGEDKTITLEQLRLPQSTSNALVAKILIGNSNHRFYTVEARRLVGYDQNVPGAAVIIHEVDTARSGNGGHAMVVDGDSNLDVNDAGAMWTPGETFTDAVNNISVQVLSAGATSFTVRIINNSTPDPNPDPPSNLSSYGDVDSITLQWNDNSYNEDGFKIYKWNGFDFVYLATVPANSTSFTETGLFCGADHSYRVSAFTSTMESERVGFVRGMTNPCTPTLDTPLPGSNPQTPEVTLKWYFVGGADHYEVRLGPFTSPPVVDDHVVGTSYLLSDPIITTYYWQVRAVNFTGGKSPWSERRMFMYGSTPDAAPLPNNFATFTPTLSWNRVSWATEYHIQIARDPGFTDMVYENLHIDKVFLSVTQIMSEGTYYWRVRALKGDEAGKWTARQRYTLDVP